MDTQANTAFGAKKVSATHVVMHAQVKPKQGKGAARELRRQGFVPGVIYAAGHNSESIAVNLKDLQAALRLGRFFTHVHELNLGGTATKVLARDIQRDPVTEQPLHIDFIRYNPASKVHVNVTVKVVGESDSPGLKMGGVLQLVEAELEVVCRADSIPAEIEVSVAGLDIGDSVHLSSIKLPQCVKSAVTDRDLTIVSVVSTRTSTMAELDAPVVAPAAEVPASNQKAPAAGAAAPAAAGSTKDAKGKESKGKEPAKK
jgi:large subunit ribosomal protein L25